jgi:hypothetical protein
LLFSQSGITYKLDKTLLPLKIYFHDSLSGHVDSFDIVKRNPYNKLPYTKTGINGEENYKYQLKKIEVYHLLNLNDTLDSLKIFKTSEFLQEPFKGTSQFSIFRESKKYVSIGYTFVVINSFERIIFITSTLLVYDCNGKLIFRNKNIDVNIDQTAVSENAKIVAFNYGTSDDDGIFIDGGFRIYNISDNRLILERQHENIGYPSIRNNVIFFWSNTEYNNSDRTAYVFDSDKREFYSKKYTYDDIENLQEITDKGFIFKKNGIKKIDTYRKDFYLETIK